MIRLPFPFYGRPSVRALACALIVGALAAPAHAAARDAAPQIVLGSQGESQVVFRNDCVVSYDANGRETRSLPACSRDQRDRARVAIDAYRRDHGLGRSGADRSASATEPARITMTGGGRGRVAFGDRCGVNYDDRGRRQEHSGRCTSGDLERADRAMAAYRRDQGLFPGGTGTTADARVPQIVMRRDGVGEVIFVDQCVVRYDERGRRSEVGRRCDDDQVRRADRAMQSYRREQGYDRSGRRDGSAGSAGGRVIAGADDRFEVRFGDGCSVWYDRDGQRLDTSRRCSAEQLKEAGELEVRARLLRLEQEQRGQGN